MIPRAKNKKNIFYKVLKLSFILVLFVILFFSFIGETRAANLQSISLQTAFVPPWSTDWSWDYGTYSNISNSLFGNHFPQFFSIVPSIYSNDGYVVAGAENHGSTEAWVMKVNNLGVTAWTKKFGNVSTFTSTEKIPYFNGGVDDILGQNHSAATDIAQAPGVGYVVSIDGSTSQKYNCTIKKLLGGTKVVPCLNQVGDLVKLDAYGNTSPPLGWEKTFIPLGLFSDALPLGPPYGPYRDGGFTTVTADSSGAGYLAMGHFFRYYNQECDTFPVDGIVVKSVGVCTIQSAWAVKVDYNGNKSWEYRYDSLNPRETIWPLDVTDTPDGGFVVVGYIGYLYNATRPFAMKLNSAGGVVWRTDQMISDFNSFSGKLRGVLKESDGTVVVVGNANSYGFAAKINYSNGSEIWSNVYYDSTLPPMFFTSITKDLFGASYFVSGGTALDPSNAPIGVGSQKPLSSIFMRINNNGVGTFIKGVNSIGVDPLLLGISKAAKVVLSNDGNGLVGVGYDGTSAWIGNINDGRVIGKVLNVSTNNELLVHKGDVTSGLGGVPDGKINCGPLFGPCSAGYPEVFSAASTVTLKATPAVGYTLGSWGGDCTSPSGNYCSPILMASDKNVTATFTPTIQTITTKANPVGSGSIIVTGGTTGIIGDLRILTPIPSPGYAFSSWSITPSDGTGGNIVIGIYTFGSVNATITANFVLTNQTAIVAVSPAGKGTATINGVASATGTIGQAKPLAYTANYGYAFSSWSVLPAGIGGTVNVSGNTYTFGSFDAIVTANFTPLPVEATLTADKYSVQYKEATALHWSSTYATSCTGTGFDTGGATSGSVPTAQLTATTQYTLKCDGLGLSKTITISVTVLAQTIGSLHFSPNITRAGKPIPRVTLFPPDPTANPPITDYEICSKPRDSNNPGARGTCDNPIRIGDEVDIVAYLADPNGYYILNSSYSATCNVISAPSSPKCSNDIYVVNDLTKGTELQTFKINLVQSGTIQLKITSGGASQDVIIRVPAIKSLQ